MKLFANGEFERDPLMRQAQKEEQTRAKLLRMIYFEFEAGIRNLRTRRKAAGGGWVEEMNRKDE